MSCDAVCMLRVSVLASYFLSIINTNGCVWLLIPTSEYNTVKDIECWMTNHVQCLLCCYFGYPATNCLEIHTDRGRERSLTAVHKFY